MARITLSDVKASRIPEALNIPPTDTRLAQWLNEAVQQLLVRGKWWGTVARYRVSVTDGLMTLPREIATIERVALDRTPMRLHDFWFEFLENGFGIREEEDGIDEVNMVGHFPVISDIITTGNPKKLRLVCDLAADVTVEVLVLGYDKDGNWVRTTQGGVLADGESIALAQVAGTLSTTQWGEITGIQFNEARSGRVYAYEYDTVLHTSRLIGQYEYNETRPSYARYILPSILSSNPATTVDVLGKLEFIPVSNDTDYVLIGNIPALKLACLSVKAAEEFRWDESAGLLARACGELDQELKHYRGEGNIIGVNLQGSSVGSVEPIYNLQ